MSLFNMKCTLVVGASTNPDRYANKAARALLEKGHEIMLYGLNTGEIAGQKIYIEFPFCDCHTVTMYVGPRNQHDMYNYIIKLKPKRVIFNPGTENPEFYKLLEKNNIEYLEACTLVLLSLNSY